MKLISIVARLALLLLTASPLVLAVGMTIYVFLIGAPIITSKGLDFLLGTRWDPRRDIYGVFPMLIGSGIVSLGALAICLPFSLCAGISISEYLRSWQKDMFRYFLFIFAGIPAVVYGFFGLVVIVPFVREHLGGPGYSIVAASLTLALMILPTLSIAIDAALFNVPAEFREAALACSGATRLQSIRYIVLPIAKPGIVAGMLLGLGRVIGETSAVLLLTGNVASLPRSVTSPIRTLTANIALELGEATGEHRQAVFASAFILIVFIVLLNWSIQTITKKQL